MGHAKVRMDEDDIIIPEVARSAVDQQGLAGEALEALQLGQPVGLARGTELRIFGLGHDSLSRWMLTRPGNRRSP